MMCIVCLNIIAIASEFQNEPAWLEVAQGMMDTTLFDSLLFTLFFIIIIKIIHTWLSLLYM